MGPAATKNFLAGSTPPLHTIRHLVSALADRTNEFDLGRVYGLLKVATSARPSTRTAPAWGVVRGGEIVPLPGEYPTTADVLGEGVKLARSLVADADAEGIDPAAVKVLHPVPQARVYCQGANYRSHMIESGMDPDRAFNMLFTKSTASLTGPDDDIVTPPHVRLLDYEVELGIVIGKADHRPGHRHRRRPGRLRRGVRPGQRRQRARRPAAQGQWYKGKSYRTFCPVGPYLCVPDPDEVSRWRELRLTLSVNGEPRQDSLAATWSSSPPRP